MVNKGGRVTNLPPKLYILDKTLAELRTLCNEDLNSCNDNYILFIYIFLMIIMCHAASRFKDLILPAAPQPALKDVSQQTDSDEKFSTSLPSSGYVSTVKECLPQKRRTSSSASAMIRPTLGKYYSLLFAMLSLLNLLQLDPVYSPMFCNGTSVILQLLRKCPAPSML